jgi:hypothetical protein
MLNRLATLEEIEDAVWRELCRAPHDRHHEWRTPVLASVDRGDDGTAWPDARTVVLREVDADAKALVIYTDSRTAKAQQLARHPAAVLVFWSTRLGWQLRCRAGCLVETDGPAVSSRWQRIRQSASAKDYLSPLAPGTPLEAGSSGSAQRESFAAVTARIERIDWLELHRDGHRRAVFGQPAAHWVQP